MDIAALVISIVALLAAGGANSRISELIKSGMRR